MTRHWSLRGRLTRRVLTGLTLGWLGALVVGLWVISHEMDELIDEGLSAQARFALELAQRTGNLDGMRPGRNEVMRLVRAGAPSDPAPWPDGLAEGASRAGEWHVYRLISVDRSLAMEIGHRRTLWHDEFMETGRAFLLLMLPLLLMTLLVIQRTVTGSLRPLTDLADHLGRRRADDLSPFLPHGLPDELRPIPEALNVYLARIDALLQSERAFAGNAAHELRTPIAVASAQAQLLASGRAGPETAMYLVGALERLTRLTERLLELSRAEAGIARAGQRCDLVRLLRVMIAGLPNSERIRFDDGDIETAEVNGDPDALAILIGNLVQNGLDHGTGTVVIRLSSATDLRITNPVARYAAFHRQRLEKGPQSHGAGLGLAIVEAIALQQRITIAYDITDKRAEVRLTFERGDARAPHAGLDRFGSLTKGS